MITQGLRYRNDAYREAQPIAGMGTDVTASFAAPPVSGVQGTVGGGGGGGAIGDGLLQSPGEALSLPISLSLSLSLLSLLLAVRHGGARTGRRQSGVRITGDHIR